jgi:hypothetical protein
VDDFERCCPAGSPFVADIILKHYAMLTDESSRQEAELLSGKLSGKLAPMKPVGRISKDYWQRVGSQTAATATTDSL